MSQLHKGIAKMPVVLYGFIASPPLRSTMMTCEALGVDYRLKVVEAFRREHLQPEYLKLNPLHTIPTMTDGDYVLFDSHAISAYLANMYGKDDKWYPKDPRQRGIVDQRLHFDNSVLGLAFKNMAVPIMLGKSSDPKAVAAVKRAAKDLDTLLGDKDFVAFNWPTIADCHCASAALSIEAMVPGVLPPRVLTWLHRCEHALPGFHKVNDPAVEIIKTMRPSKL